MTSEEKFNQAIWWVLQEVKKEDLSTSKDEYICFEFQSPENSDNNSVPPKEDQRRAVRFLKNKGAIRIEHNKYPQPFTMDIIAQMSNTKPIGYFLEILQPKFDEIHKNFAEAFLTKTTEQKAELKKEIIGEIKKEQELTLKTDVSNEKPYTEVKNGKGYFKFYKQGEIIEIGGKNTRHFRLLQSLCEPRFGIQKTIEAIFEAIRQPKDKNDNDLSDWSPQRQTKILTLIEYAKKELQKNKKLQGKLKYKFDDRKRNMWLELLEG